MKQGRYGILNKYKLHFIVWLCYIIYEVVLVGLVFNSFGHPVTYASHYLLIIVLFYFHSSVLLTAAHKGQIVILKILLFVVLELSLFIFLSFLTDTALVDMQIIDSTENLTLNHQYVLKTLYRLLFFLALSTGYYYILQYNNERARTNRLEKERLENIIEKQKSEQNLLDAEIKSLRAQINPHFLFNTLDYIYHTVNQTSPVAAQAVISLADMMRYAVAPNAINGPVLLADEFEQVENFIFLSTLKKLPGALLKFTYQEHLRDMYFVPLILLTLVENIFKYGDLENNNVQAYLKVYSTDQYLIISSYNSVRQFIRPQGTKLGLDNIRKRLINAYGKQVLFEYSSGTDAIFRLCIQVPLSSIGKEPEIL